MKILIVDDENIILFRIEKLVKDELPNDEVVAFDNVEDAKSYIDQNEIYIAFLDIQIGGDNGVTLAKYIKNKYPKCNIVFSTGYQNYYKDAFDLSASDYLLKPITVEKIKHALANLRNVSVVNTPKNKLYIQCFGSFEIYLDGKIVTDIKNRTKELLAYLVDRKGGLCSNAEIMETIWEEASEVNLRQTRKLLQDFLDSIGFGNILIKGWGKLGIDPKLFACDYYDYLKGNPSAINLYRGEYMRQYSWAYYTQKELEDF